MTSGGLPSDLTCVFEAKAGKLDIKSHEPGILFISLQVDSLFKLAIMTSLSSLCQFNVIDNVIQKVQNHDDLIKAHAMRWATFIRSMCNNAVSLRGD